eukprot:1159081-Pelagomonas_calceolata.AAC.6
MPGRGPPTPWCFACCVSPWPLPNPSMLAASFVVPLEGVIVLKCCVAHLCVLSGQKPWFAPWPAWKAAGQCVLAVFMEGKSPPGFVGIFHQAAHQCMHCCFPF